MDLILLNKDVSLNALSRLPANILVQLKLVSKGWCRVIEDPDFMHLLMKTGKTMPISGFFFQERFHYSDTEIQQISYIPVGATQTQIYQNILNFLPEKVTILGSSNGLILCRTFITSPNPSLYICNPVNKQCMNLKLDRIEMWDYFAFSFEPSSIRYNLVRVLFTPEKSYFAFEIYNWKEKVWMRSKEICHSNDSLCANKKIIVESILYWLTRDNNLLIFDIRNELSSLIDLPPFEANSPEICLGESGNVLHCVVVRPDGLKVWALEDYVDSNWDLKSSISFKVMEEENQQDLFNFAERVKESFGTTMPWMQPLAFKDGILLLRVSDSAYSFNIQTKKVQLLCNMLNIGHRAIGAPIVVPYSISLIPVIDG